MILNLGTMSGSRQDPANIALTLFDSQGRSLHLVDMTQPMYVAGWVGSMLLPLPAGSGFSIAVDLSKYWPPMMDEGFEKRLAPGSYWLQAQLNVKADSRQRTNPHIGLPQMIYWAGSITSNRLRFDIPSQ